MANTTSRTTILTADQIKHCGAIMTNALRPTKERYPATLVAMASYGVFLRTGKLTAQLDDKQKYVIFHTLEVLARTRCWVAANGELSTGRHLRSELRWAYKQLCGWTTYPRMKHELGEAIVKAALLLPNDQPELVCVPAGDNDVDGVLAADEH